MYPHASEWHLLVAAIVLKVLVVVIVTVIVARVAHEKGSWAQAVARGGLIPLTIATAATAASLAVGIYVHTH